MSNTIVTPFRQPGTIDDPLAAVLRSGARGLLAQALEKVCPATRHQRCTVHKTASVLDKMLRSPQPAANADPRES